MAGHERVSRIHSDIYSKVSMFWRFESAVMSCSSRPLALKKIRDFQTVGWAAAVKHQNVLLRLTTVCLAGQYFNRAVSPSSRPLLVDCVFILDFTERCSVCSVNQQQFGAHVVFPQQEK